MNKTITDPSTTEVVAEAMNFRLILEAAKSESIRLVTEDFPVSNCMLASLLFTYHALQKWPSITIAGISGMAENLEGKSVISHYWLEYLDTAIDLTADQYNIIKREELNLEIVRSRPFEPVCTGLAGRMQNYRLFKITQRDTYISGLPELGEDFLYDLECSYEDIVSLSIRPRSIASQV
jgi:hypothetical protein